MTNNAPTDAILAELERLGTAQTRKTYLRHGACEPLFGVKFGDLRPIAKRIGARQEIADALWASGNMDAMTLALLVAEPNQIKSRQIDAWLASANYSLLSGMLADLVARSPHALAKWKKWSASKNEKTLSSAYAMLASWLVKDAGSVPRSCIHEALAAIESSIHDAPNQARHNMNQALIAIGIYSEQDRKRVYQVAKKIGKVEVDHGQTNCKTPDAATYIERALAKNRRKADV